MATSKESAPDTVRDESFVSADTDPDLDLDFDRIQAEPVRTPARERLRTLRGIGPNTEADEDAVPATMPVVTFESLAEPEQPTLPHLARPAPSTPPPPARASASAPPSSALPPLREPPPLRTPPPPPRTPRSTAPPQATPLASATPPPAEAFPPPRAFLPPLQAAPVPRAALPPPLLPAPAPRLELPSIPPLRPPPSPKTRGGVASAAAVYRAIATSRPPPKAPAPEPAATVAPVVARSVAPVAGGSVAPVALATLRPPAPPDEPAPKRRRSRRKVATVGLISGALVALGGFWSLRNVERAGVAGLHAVAEDGSAVHDVRIVVDGVERCASSPCTLTGLARGSHLASAVAPGFVPTAALAFTVHAGEPANVSFELVRVPQPPPQPVAAASPAAPLAEARAAAEVTPPDEPSAAAESAARTAISPKRASAPKAKQSAAPKAAKPAAGSVKPATGQATLSFQSAPRANVVLDGRPIGKTPLAGVSVSAGTHNVVFIGADGRRKSQVANVTAGSKRALVAKF